MARKKIVFVLVEGPSDDEALGVILNRIYDKNFVYVHVMRCDITTELDVNPGNIIAKIGDLVRKYAKDNSFRRSDFQQIIHITDMDGAFIPDENIIEDSSTEKPIYHPTEILASNKIGIEKRNLHKRENLNRLAGASIIWTDIPYRIYYMSCNLDHALYGKLNSTDEEKEADSYHFAVKYKDDIPGFLRFISESDFSIMNSYAESWLYIKEDLHSLERHTNLGLCFSAENTQSQMEMKTE